MNKTGILIAAIFALLACTQAIAYDVKPVVDLDKRVDRIDNRLDHRVDRADTRLSNKGQKVKHRLNRRNKLRNVS
jgi:hypothetical protein